MRHILLKKALSFYKKKKSNDFSSRKVIFNGQGPHSVSDLWWMHFGGQPCSISSGSEYATSGVPVRDILSHSYWFYFSAKWCHGVLYVAVTVPVQLVVALP